MIALLLFATIKWQLSYHDLFVEVKAKSIKTPNMCIVYFALKCKVRKREKKTFMIYWRTIMWHSWLLQCPYLSKSIFWLVKINHNVNRLGVEIFFRLAIFHLHYTLCACPFEKPSRNTTFIIYNNNASSETLWIHKKRRSVPIQVIWILKQAAKAEFQVPVSLPTRK